MNQNKLPKAVESAFIANHGEIRDALFEAHPDLNTFQAEHILAELAAALFQSNRRLLYKAISEALYLAPEEWSKELDDYVQDVFVHLLEHPHKLIGLLFPEKAKPTTALYALAKSRMRAVRSQLMNRHRIVSRSLKDVCAAGCEIADKPEPEPTEKMLAGA